MKKLPFLTASLAVLVVLAMAAGNVSAQTAPTAEASVPHKVGLIDMAQVFKEYKKFEVLREDLKNSILESDTKAKQMAEQIKRIQVEMKEFKAGSTDYISRETQLAKLTSDFETFRKVAQRDFLRQEAGIYHTIYLEVVDAVERYAYHFKYTLVLRFNRSELESGDPQELIKGMNRQVVYSRPSDDITLSVIDFLNRKYQAEAKAGGDGKTAVK